MWASCTLLFIISQLTISASLSPSTSWSGFAECKGVNTQLDGSSHTQVPGPRSRRCPECGSRLLERNALADSESRGGMEPQVKVFGSNCESESLSASSRLNLAKTSPPPEADPPLARGGNIKNFSEGLVEVALHPAYQVQSLNISHELEQINVRILSLKGMESKLDHICDAQKNISQKIEDVNSSVVSTISSTTCSPRYCERHLISLESAVVHGFHGVSKRFQHVNDLVERGLLNASLQRADQVDGISRHPTTSMNIQSPFLVNLHDLLRTAGTGLTITGLTISAVATLQVIEPDCYPNDNLQRTRAVS